MLFFVDSSFICVETCPGRISILISEHRRIHGDRFRTREEETDGRKMRLSVDAGGTPANPILPPRSSPSTTADNSPLENLLFEWFTKSSNVEKVSIVDTRRGGLVYIQLACMADEDIRGKKETVKVSPASREHRPQSPGDFLV